MLGRPLVIHQPSMDKMTELFAKRNMPMVESNARQALMLEGSDPLANETGLAVGVALTVDGTRYVLLPGPPSEMKPMFELQVKPWLEANVEGLEALHSTMLKFAGIGESSLEHQLIDLIDAQTDPTIAPYAKEGEVAIRLTTRAGSAQEAARKLKPLEDEIRRRLGGFIYAAEDISLEEFLLRELAFRGQTLAVAESCTGGQLSDLLTAVPGSSNAFAGGLISYTNQVKHRVLGIPLNELEGEGAPGAVSAETAIRMAEAVRTLCGADYGLSVTGVAGPRNRKASRLAWCMSGLRAGARRRRLSCKHGATARQSSCARPKARSISCGNG